MQEGLAGFRWNIQVYVLQKINIQEFTGHYQDHVISIDINRCKRLCELQSNLELSLQGCRWWSLVDIMSPLAGQCDAPVSWCCLPSVLFARQRQNQGWSKLLLCNNSLELAVSTVFYSFYFISRRFYYITLACILTNNFIIWYSTHLAFECLSSIWILAINLWVLGTANKQNASKMWFWPCEKQPKGHFSINNRQRIKVQASLSPNTRPPAAVYDCQVIIVFEEKVLTENWGESLRQGRSRIYD